ncbi:Uncharacterized metal-binding protein YceD, DUF177 family [Shimia gijangensis]|uniref:Uncharacterized metal-binding protein YceD, DUF177 family n=1 Tax=Shimia gijangensis TaxID=1470563 RepID=A0A1M6E540_9RHOB|nr:DUF177 domain-containing protein [Shimia gijangensis]SHI80388.1 Uncharacterized metal-binding protein YceD, DUF177 family [Shimia gijangensis]
MNDSASDTVKFRIADLPQNRPTPFELRPDAAFCKALVAELGLVALRKLSFVGELCAVGKSDWELSAKLGATIVQPCVVTLEPVTTRIDVTVRRLFLSQQEMSDSENDDEEVEMPDDENADLLGTSIDVDQIMSESLALNLPLYPRAEDAKLANAVFTEPGQTPMKDEDARPFAGLADLRNKLAKDGEK